MVKFLLFYIKHFLSGAIFFLTVEMAFNWGFWEAYNQTGKPCKFDIFPFDISLFIY